MKQIALGMVMLVAIADWVGWEPDRSDRGGTRTR